MHKIHKQFGFAYGHRVWSQELDIEYSLDACLACRHLHGHEGLVTVTLSSAYLERGMVIDFKYLNWFKQWIDDVVDHKFIIDINDPMFTRITGAVPSAVKYRSTICVNGSKVPNAMKIGYIPLIANMQEGFDTLDEATNEVLESFVIVDFVPTSENISKWFFDIVKAKMAPLSNVTVDSVAINETPKSQAVFSE